MGLAEELEQITVSPERCLNMTYDQLNACDLEFDFASVVRDGRDFHRITRDICISVQRFESGHLTNLFYSGAQAYRVDLNDEELVNYYSDYIELRYILSGQLEVEIEGELAHFDEDEVCFINSMAYHRESIQGSKCTLLNVNVRRNVLGDDFIDSVNASPLQQFLRRNVLKSADEQNYLRFTSDDKEQTKLIQECLLMIVNELRGRRPGYMDISRGYLMRVMDELSLGYQHNVLRQDGDAFSETLFEAVSEYMRNNLSTVSVGALAEEFHFHLNYFNKLIKRHTGMTYSEYLIWLRVERAKQLLRSTDLSVENVALLVGYSNKGFFYRKFVESTGLSPARYRAQAAGK